MDRTAWAKPLEADVDPTLHTQRFRAASPVGSTTDGAGAPRAVARTEHLGMYVRSFADGRGENGLHSHPDDAIWFVVDGSAEFHGPGHLLLGRLGPQEGILVPAGTSYRFRCLGATTLARISAPTGQPHPDG